MKHSVHKVLVMMGALLLLGAPRVFAQPSAEATAAFNTYVAQVEARLARQHESASEFMGGGMAWPRLRSGELLIENLKPPAEPPGALAHHWRATAFVPNATAAEFEHLLRDFGGYPREFAPEVIGATVVGATPMETLLRLRTREHHGLTVVLDTTCAVSFGALDARHGYSISRSTRIEEIAPAGDEGLLYRLNTYWTWEQRDGGLYVQLESVSLTRGIPPGLGWAVAPYLESIPRDSLVFTLTSARKAMSGKQ